MAADTTTAALYVLFNMASSLGIVFANKAVFAVFHFPYPFLLTLIHIVFTAFGMQVMAMTGFFERKTIPWRSLIDLAVVYVGYIVLGNLSIKLNPVGFYQIVKALIPPAVLLVTSVQTRRMPSAKVMAAVALLTIGVIAATVTDDEVMGNLPGMLTGVACVFATAGYNILAGSKQTQLGANSSQLCLRFSPLAACLLAAALPLIEPEAIMSPFRSAPDATAGAALSPEATFHPTPLALLTVLLSAALGLLVTLSTFLVIGATSALTYNVVGHVKTAGVILGGVLLYGEAMPLKKLAGLVIGGAGIAWYSQIKFAEGAAAKPSSSAPPPPPAIKTGTGDVADGGGAGSSGWGNGVASTSHANGGMAKAESFDVGGGGGASKGARNWAGQVVSPRRGHKQ